MAMKNPCKVITGRKTVFSYLNVNEPKAPMGGGTPKYSVSLIIPKSDKVTYGKLRGTGKTVPKLEDLKLPLRDGDKKGDDAYKGCWYVNANSTTKPGVVDADCNPILDSSELYSGIIGRASITFYCFNSSGNRGIACGLNNLQKLADGTALGGHARPEDDFAEADDGDDFLD